jgi:tetratricopeptide (TPR) repeat protein
MQLDRSDEALAAFDGTLLHQPDHARAANNRGVLRQLRKEYAAAISSFRMAIASDPDYIAALYNLGTALQEDGVAGEAVAVFRELLKKEPGNAAAWTNLGNAWLAHNDIEAATACYLETLRLAPNEPAAEWNLGIAALLAGDFRAGWAGYERRFDVKGATPRRALGQPLWSGESLEGKTLLLHAEQGLGDTIQFIRYAPEFARRGARVIVECQAALVPLLRGMQGVADWFAAPAADPMHGGLQPVDHLPRTVYQLPFLSAPYLARTTPDSIPSPGRYLRAPKAACARWAEWLGKPCGALRVGLVWAGNPKHKNDRNRSIPVHVLEVLGGASGIEWINLQKGHAAPDSLAMRDAACLLTDFSDTAGLVENLDLVVSVDTSVAHLAGALGKPVWVLLPYAPDWRWMLNREDSPWYESARLFRQSEPGAWPEVLRDVLEALGSLRV